jgi:nucleotide-binding universal stress UspA family protein
MFERILVGVDDSESARRAVSLAGKIAVKFEAQAGLVHAIDAAVIHRPTYGEETRDCQKAGISKCYEFLASFHPLVGEGVHVGDFVAVGRAADEIVERAQAWKADLVIVGSRHHNAISRLILGITAERVVRNAPCPVLVVRDVGTARESGKWRVESGGALGENS